MRLRGAAPAAIWGTVGPIVFIASWIVAGSLRDGYRISDDSISQLAELGAPNRWIVFTGTVVVSLSALALGALLHQRWRTKLATPVVAIAGISALALAIFPCSPGCPGISGEWNDSAHSLAGIVHYIAFGSAPIVLAVNSRGLTPPSYRVTSILAGLFAGAFLISQYTGWGPPGITQRIGLTTLDTWMVATAWMALRLPRAPLPLGSRPRGNRRTARASRP